MTEQSAQAVVFDIPELVQAIIVFLDHKTLLTVRSLNRTFHLQCEPHFSIFLITEHRQRYRQLGNLVNLAKEHPDSLGPLNVIKGLHLSYQHNLYQDFQESVRHTLAAVLNRCCNLREISVEDRPGDYGLPSEKPQYLARLAWANFDVHQFNPCGPLDDDERPWSFFDILPLEGSMLHRLETLKLVTSTCTPSSLDRFFKRLEESPAAKTLRSLAVTGSWNHVRSTSWDTLRSCVCNLKALHTLAMDSLQIVHRPTDKGIEINREDEEAIWLAPRVRTLTFKCRPDLNTKLAVMNLFPNVESLSIGNTAELWEKAVDEHLFQKAIDHPTSSRIDTVALPKPIPFPRLKQLDVRIRSSRDWDEALLLHKWAQRQPHFRLQSLSLRASERPSHQPATKELITTLAKYPVSVKELQVTGRDRPQLCQILKSSIVQRLDTLELSDFGLDFIESVQEVLQPGLSAKMWQITRSQERSLRELLPWSRTLTRLLLMSTNSLGFYSGHDAPRKTSSIYSLQSLLRMLPRLEDFELLEPIEDLVLFEGLGRARVLDITEDADMNLELDLDLDLDLDLGSGMGLSFHMDMDRDMDMDMSWISDCTTVSKDSTSKQATYPLESYSITENPLLKRLRVVQSPAVHDPRYYDQLTPWHIELKHKFRFLTDLNIKRQGSPYD